MDFIYDFEPTQQSRITIQDSKLSDMTNVETKSILEFNSVAESVVKPVECCA